jgi:hypothetical protein
MNRHSTDSPEEDAGRRNHRGRNGRREEEFLSGARSVSADAFVYRQNTESVSQAKGVKLL